MSACGLCGASDLRQRFFSHGTAHQQCRACGFRFARPDTNPNLENSLAEFESAYLQYLGPSGIDRANHERLLAWMERYRPLTPGTRLLDVGAGSGKWLSFVGSARSVRAAGVEPSKALHEHYQLQRWNVAATTLPMFDRTTTERFDVISAFDVIEHVPDPVEFACALAHLLEPGGFVFLSTPDVGSLLTSVMGRRWHHFHRYHVSFFDRRTIATLGRGAGFKTLSVSHRSKRMPLSYIVTYGRDFLFGARRFGTGQAEGWGVPVNLFDIMSVVWQRPASDA
jgi:2-polyprenyl-3-methyl-5-hydroxy-6-metoxy-1,4-benzoquinol methylase